MKTEQDEFAVNFLLGKLSDEEQTRIEADFFNSNPAFENILIAENELIDAYVTGNLSPDDRTRFENRLLLNPQQKQRVEFAKTLIEYSSDFPLSAKVASSSIDKPTFLTSISRFFSAKPVLSFSFAVFALVLSAGGLWWAANNNFSDFPRTDELAKTHTPEKTEIQETLSETKDENRSSENITNTKIETVKENKPVSPKSPKTNKNQIPSENAISSKAPDTNPKKSAPIISTIILSFGAATRGASEKAMPVNIPAKTNLVNLQLKFDEGDFRSFFAVLETVEGQQIWSGKALKSNENSAIVTVPSRLLKKGDYIITLKGLKGDGFYETVADYSFNVERR
ncbi:MAG TPA: hypothetical protein VF556_15545 [Pyrinomonadaceae bacterium]|jgi:hypothetical protein